MSFRLVPKSVTLNGIMTVILRYFTKIDVVLKQLPRFQNLLLIVCDHIIQRSFGQNKLITRFDGRRCIGD